jgi:hypothetical protein
VFRATSPTVATDGYRGYYAGITPAGQVILGKANNNWTRLAAAPMAVTVGTRYHLRVEAIGSSVKVFVGDMSTPRITVTDATYATGATGVRVYNAAAAFDNVVVTNR